MAGGEPALDEPRDRPGRRDVAWGLSACENKRGLGLPVDVDPSPSPVRDRALRASLAISAVILTLGALSLASSVMTPVAFALFIIALVRPLQRRLQRRLPQLLAVLVTAAVALLAIGLGCWLIVWGFGQIAQWIIANSARLQSLYTRTADLLEARGLYAAEFVAQQFNMSWILGVVRSVGAGLQGKIGR